MGYGYLGTMRAQAGRRDEVVALLRGTTDGEPMPGCVAYVVGTSEDDPDLIWVSEVWTDKAAHDASLALPAVRASIETVMPLLTGEFTSQELDVRAAFGLAEGDR